MAIRVAAIRTALGLKIAFGITVVLANIIFLVAGSAQQRVMDSLSQTAPGKHISFSEARSAFKESRRQTEDQTKNQEKRTALQKKVAVYEVESSRNASAILIAGRQIRSAVAMMPEAAQCDFPSYTEPNVDQELELAGKLATCVLAMPTRSETIDKLSSETKAAADRIVALRKAQSDIGVNIKYLDDQIEFLSATIATATLSDDLTPKQLAGIFSEIDAMDKSPFSTASFVWDIPPFVLQMALATTSGLFGALLITLILIVYPNNNYNITKSSDYYARIILGGLVALCVYMVLGAGASIIGGSLSGIDAAKLNIMGLSFVCVLAGAFSDRVAGWLSRSAKLFDEASRTLQPPGSTASPPDPPPAAPPLN